MATTLVGLASAEEHASHEFWPAWRGPLGTGASESATPPLEWDESTNVRWKVEVPGLGHSSPVVWGDRVFLTTAVPVGPELPPKFSGRPGAHDNLPVTRAAEFRVVALDRADGSVAWSTTVRENLPHEGGHVTGSLASATPATDGERVYAFFGSHGLYALDATTGETLWSSDLGDMFTKHGHGEGSSPALAEGVLVVNWDHEEESFLTAFDAASGRERWRVSRDEGTSWSSPVVVRHGGGSQVIVAATNRLRGYDLADGRLIWEAGGLANNVVATPVVADGVVVAGSSYEKRSMIAVRLEGAQGDVTDTPNHLWTRIQRTPYVPSPLYYRGHLYFLMHYQGILTRADPETGDDVGGPFRLFGMRDLYASPVAADGRVYLTDRSAGTLVISADDPTDVLAVNRLDDRFSATPALAGNDLILRGERWVYCLSETPELPKD